VRHRNAPVPYSTALALLWGQRADGVGGTRPPRRSPLGETGKGIQDSLLAAAGYELGL
jgi:hypothetical protein